jgi:hypothetical protein
MSHISGFAPSIQDLTERHGLRADSGLNIATSSFLIFPEPLFPRNEKARNSPAKTNKARLLISFSILKSSHVAITMRNNYIFTTENMIRLGAFLNARLRTGFVAPVHHGDGEPISNQ